MNGKVLKLLLIPVLIVLVVACSTNKPLTSQIAKTEFTIAADVRNDSVQGVTPQIEQAILNDYLSDKKVQKQSTDFKRIVNSAEITGGTAFLVRTKSGFSAYFLDASNQKAQFVAGWEWQLESKSSDPGGCSLMSIPDQSNELTKKIIVGVFNLDEAAKATITWRNGQQTTHNLTNGTLIIESKNNEYVINQWEVFDSSGKSLYKQLVND
ncbi:MAG: hypothetical protein ABRQ25_14025 [Clostridiaceae bacterium]